MRGLRRIGTRLARALPRLRPADRGDGPRAPGAAADSPFLAARTEFTNAFGDLAQGKRNWQLLAFALAGLLALVTIANVRLAGAAHAVPYVVQVDRLGQVVAVGPATELHQPDARLVAAQLAQFVRAIRTVLPAAAAAAEAELIRRGYAFAAPAAAATLNDYFADPTHDPRVLGLRLTRQVDVTGVLRVPHSDAWRLQWTETERSTEPGGLTRVVAWEGYVTVRLGPPATPETLQDNPLGLAVTSVSWTQVGDPTTGDPPHELGAHP